MSKRWILILGLLAVLGLVACGPTVAPTREQAATATRPEAAATDTQAAATATVAQKSVPTATPATASQPGTMPTPSWQIPQVRDGEWTKGSDDAGLVLVEYSDFQ